MDAILRLLGRRARSEDSKEAWEAYASALERLAGVPQPFQNVSEEINFLSDNLHLIILGLPFHFEQVLWAEATPSIYYVRVTDKADSLGVRLGTGPFLSGWILIPGSTEDDGSYENLSSMSMEILRRYGVQTLGLQALPTIGHWSFSTHLRDNEGWVLGDFEVEFA